MISIKVVQCQLKFKEQRRKEKLGSMQLTFRKENVAVGNGRCLENHALMLYTYLGK